MQETLVSVAAGALAALKAGGLVPKEPALAMPLVITALDVTVALAWPDVAWIARQRAKPLPS